MAALGAPAAAFFALGGSAHQVAPRSEADSVAGDTEPCCLQVMAAASTASSWTLSNVSPGPGEMAPASRWRGVAQNMPQALPVGLAPERGQQVKTILAARSISAA